MKYIIFLILLLSPSSYADLIKPIPLHIDIDEKKAFLGKKLFFDTILSKDGTVACVSCHALPGSGTDNLPVSIGIDSQKGNINSPTVLNAYFNFVQFWDGRVMSLKEQALKPIVNPVEMGASLDMVLRRLKNDSTYSQLFINTYGEVSADALADSIAEFEKALFTPNAPVDRYLRGDKSALTKIQKEGYDLFVARGCVACHNGVNVGGNMYAKFGVFEEKIFANKGRFNVTKDEEDLYFFKVPSLRNIALSSPYFHDASEKKLYNAIHVMGKYQLGRKLSKAEIQKIELFLKGLSGETPKILKN